MTTISGGMSYATSTQWSAPPPRMPRGGDGGQQGPSLDELFSKIDTDGDGSISMSELKTALQSSDDGTGSSGTSSTSSTSGTSSDGSSTSANSVSGLGLSTQGFAAMMGGGMPPPPPPPPDGGQGGPGFDLGSLDTNQDGSISKSEFGLSDSSSTSTSDSTSATSSSSQDQEDLFKAIDSNGDGSLSKDEVQGFEKKMRALFEAMQQMGQQNASGTSNATGSSSSTSTTVSSLSLVA